MEYEIKEVSYDNLDFRKLCVKLDEFQNVIVPERVELGFSTLKGLEKLQKILVMYDKDIPIASVALKPIKDGVTEVARVYTEEKYRGNGLAKILIEKIIQFAREQGYEKVILDTWKRSSSARRLYEKLGFTEIPMFDSDTLKNSFSIKNEDENKIRQVQELLVFMEKQLDK